MAVRYQQVIKCGAHCIVLLDVVRWIKLRRMSWVGHVALMADKRNVERFLWGNVK
jgi:hypothetical protein